MNSAIESSVNFSIVSFTQKRIEKQQAWLTNHSSGCWQVTRVLGRVLFTKCFGRKNLSSSNVDLFRKKVCGDGAEGRSYQAVKVAEKLRYDVFTRESMI